MPKTTDTTSPPVPFAQWFVAGIADLFKKCERTGCEHYFPRVKGKRFHNPSCRAAASLEARMRGKFAHRVPEMTPERRFYKRAAVWLGERIA